MNVSWALYKAELKSPTPEAFRHQRTTEPKLMTGFWKIESARTKPSYPVMIWTEADVEKNPTGATIFQIGNMIRNTAEHPEEWGAFTQGSWLHCVAVERDAYAAAMNTGLWADQKPARQLTAEQKLGIDVPTSEGGNNPPPAESLADQISALLDKVMNLEVVDQATADTASSYLDKMRKLLELAEAERVKEKEPFLDGGRKVDAKWAAIRDPGITAGAKLKAARDAWLKREQARLNAIAAEENRKRETEAAEAAKAEAERFRKETEAAGQQVDEQEIAARVAETVAPIVPVEPEKAKASSAFGRASSAKKTRVVKITDQALFINFLIDTRHPDTELAEFLQKKAEKIIRAKMTAPGVEVSEE